MGAGPTRGDDAHAAGLEEARRRIAALTGHEGAAFYDVLVRSMSDGLSVLDEHGVHIDVNPALCRMAGFSRDELIGTGPPHPYWPEEQLPAIEAAMAETLGGAGRSYQLVFQRKSGERFPVLVTPTALRDDRGALVCAFAVVRDMTELREAEVALAESEQLFRLTFDESPVGAVVVGPDFNFRRVNASFCAMTGYTAGELARLGFPDITHPDDVEADKEGVRRLLAGEVDSYAREKRYVRKDGGFAWGDIAVRCVRDAGGEPLFLLAIVVDRTERHLAQDEAAARADEARAGRDRLAALVDSIPDEIWFSDAEGRFTLANPAAVAVFGAGASPGTDVRDLAASLEVLRADGTPRPVEEAPPLRALAGETVRNLEEIVRTPGAGDLRHRLVSASPVNGPDGAVVGSVSVVRDITVLRRAEAALHESEQRYRSVVEASHEGITLQARDGTILTWNRAAQEVFGPSEEEIVGVSAVDREWGTVHEDGTPWPASDHPSMHTLATGEPCEDVLVGLRRGAEQRWINVNTRPLWAEGDPLPVAVVVSFADVTAQRRAVEALEAERARAQSYLDIADVMLVALDASGAVTMANRKACEVLGRDERDVVGRDWFDLAMPGEIREPLRELYGAYVRNESNAYEHLENPVVTSSGEQRLIAWHNAPLRDETGRVVGVLRSGRDITVQRATDQALCDSEERYRLLVRHAYDGVWVHELSPEGPGRIVEVNDRACEMLGYTRDELLEMQVTDVDTPEQHAQTPRIARQLAETGHAVFETEHVRKDGGRVPVEISASTFDLRGRTVVLSVIRDITERRAAQRLLRESEERYREVVERANDGIVITDETRLLFANAAFARMSGYADDDLEQKILLDFVQQKDRGAVAERVRRRLAGGDEPETYEIDLVGKDGALFSVEVNAGTISLQGRTADLVVMRDVGERRKVLAALQELRAMRDTAERVAHVGSWRFDLASGVVAWSPGTYALYDVDEDGFDGDFRPVLESRVHPDDRDLVAGDIARYEHADQPGPLEFRVVHRDGSVHLLHGEGRLERAADGTPAAVVGFIQDATEQREAERSVREAEQRFRSLFEESPVAMWYEDASALLTWQHDLAGQGVTDLAAHLGGDPEALAGIGALVRIDSVNRASLEVFGAATADEISRGFLRTFTAETYSALLDAVQAFARGASTFSRRCAFRRFDGTPRTLDLSLSLAGGGAVGRDHVLASFIDVTDQERAESEVRRLNAELERRIVSRTEQLDAATHELEALAYSMAHDVRAPLRTIDGFSAILMEEEAGHLSPESVDNLRRVRKAAQTLAGLLDDLTGLSAVSRHDLARERVDLSAVAAEVARELRAQRAARHVDVDVEPGLEAFADPYLVRLVFHELLDNAWKFTAPRRHAHVRVGAVAVEENGGRAFFVRDDGVGFDMAYAAHLFGAFQRMHPPGEFAGNGIGLAMVQRLVRRHGGRVWAESEVGEGATFFFTLPPPGDG